MSAGNGYGYGYGRWRMLKTIERKPDLEANRWAMEERPSKRSSLEFLYTFRRAQGAYEYRLESWAADTLERRRKDQRFGEIFEKQLEASNV